MPRKNIFFFVLVVLAGLVFLAAASLPYGALKSLADSMMSDGNFKSLKEGNALVFKIALGAIGLLFFGVAYVIRTGRFKDIINWLHQYFIDLADFFRALIPVKVEAVSLVALMLIIVLAVILRLAHIADPMTHDESYTFLVFSSTSIFNITTNYHLPNNHVLNSLLIFFSTHLFGIQPWAVRLPSMLAGVLLVPATYILAKAIYDRYTALVSAFLIAILPGAILYSTVARGYILVALFTVLTLWLANYLRENKNWFAWSLLVLFMALGFYSVPVMMFPCGVVFAWLFFGKPG